MKSVISLTFIAGAAVLLSNSAIAAELARPLTPSERHYAQQNIAQDSDTGALPPKENALDPVPDTADALYNPARQLQSVPVKSSDGKAVGRIENVKLAPDGHARSVEIAIAGRTISLGASLVLYDPSDRVAHLSIPQSAVIAMANGEGVTASLEPRIY